MTGGGSRPDIQSLVVLRPAAFFYLAYGLYGLRWEDVSHYRYLFGIAFVLVLLVVLHLVPLPPTIWQGLPGRELATDIDRASGFDGVWRPISLVPWATWNALFALAIPLAAMTLMMRLDREDQFKLLSPILFLGIASALLGFLQAIGPANGPLYFYNITNLSSAVGLFANRNHQAVLLAALFPMLAVFASVKSRTVEQAQSRKIFAISIGVILVPLILVTGSRAGLVTGLIALSSVGWLYRMPNFRVPPKRGKRNFPTQYVLGAVILIGLGLASAVFSRAEALSRIFQTGSGEEVRFAIWKPVVDMSYKYFPIGSGIGSFTEIYQIDEPNNTLSYFYMNHAHNDWLETIMTAGLPGILILLFLVFAWGKLAFQYTVRVREKSTELIFARLGTIIILILAAASFVDYPARVPSLGCLFVVAAVWMSKAKSLPKSRDEKTGSGDRGLVASGQSRN